MQSHENRFAAGVLQWATRLYPPEKREWGEAILAESYEVTGAGPKLRWTLGGLNMALRAFLSNLFSFGSKRPGLDSGPQGAIAPIPWEAGAGLRGDCRGFAAGAGIPAGVEPCVF